MKINIKSDFKIITYLTDSLGNIIDPFSIDFAFNYYSYNNKKIKYTISNLKGIQTNCKKIDNKLILIFENHNFNSNRIGEERHFFIPDEDFKDKINDIYIDNQLDLNNFESNCYEYGKSYFDYSKELEKIIIPFIKGESAYEAAIKGGFIGTKEEFYISLNSNNNGNFLELETEESNLISFSYEDKVNFLIRERYSLSEELAILRQRDIKTQEFIEYNSYCEECKIKAKE